MKRYLSAVVPMILVMALPTTANASDPRFVRMWESAQRERPADLVSVSRIAPSDEPGQRFVVHGAVLLPDGRSAAGVVLFAYQTDSGGLYAKPSSTTPWRLKGWAVTDSAGRFEFGTIRPGPYPDRSTPAHIHLSLITTCCGRQLNDLMFEGDPLATPGFRSRFAEAGEHGLYASVRTVDGVQHATFNIQLRPQGDF